MKHAEVSLDGQGIGGLFLVSMDSIANVTNYQRRIIVCPARSLLGGLFAGCHRVAQRACVLACEF